LFFKKNGETIIKYWNLAFHYWANVRVLIDDRQCRQEWKGPNDSHIKTIHHIHTQNTRETYRDQMKQPMEQIVVLFYSHVHIVTLYLSILLAARRVWAEMTSMLLPYTHKTETIHRGPFVYFFYLPFERRWSLCTFKDH